MGLGAAVLASRQPPLLLLAAAALLAIAAWLIDPPRAVPAGPLGIALVAFVGLALASTWIWGGHYTPVAVYTMALLAAAFFVGRRLGQSGRSTVAIAILVAAAAVVCAQGLWHYWHYIRLGDPLGYPRARAWFETPNLMAAFVNLALVPTTVVLMLRGLRPLPLIALVLLWAGLVAAHSRGAWLGLTVSAAFLALMLVGRWRPSATRLGAIALTAALGYGLAHVGTRLLPGTLKPGDRAPSARLDKRFASTRVASAAVRFELYALAARGLRAHPVAGSGYLSFGRLFERDRAAVPSYRPGTDTQFVHDDYLQVLLELGVIGLLPFLAITWLVPALAYRRKATLDPASAGDAVGIAATAALVAMATHGLVDFPFYVPGTLAGYGLLLGVADSWLHPAPDAVAPAARRPATAPMRLLRAGLVALGAYALAMPAAAAGCAAVARARVQHGDVAGAVYWLQVARNFDPRDWRRDWQLGSLLAQQAVLLRSPKVAQLAADSFAAGVRADPGDVHNRLGWLNVERLFGTRLARPATPAELRARLRETVRLAPLDTAVRVERVLVLRHLGETARARAAAAALQRDFPRDAAVRRLLAPGARG